MKAQALSLVAHEDLAVFSTTMLFIYVSQPLWPVYIYVLSSEMSTQLSTIFIYYVQNKILNCNYYNFKRCCCECIVPLK